MVRFCSNEGYAITDVMKVSPPRFSDGPVQGAELEKAFSVFYRDVLARMDIRYPNNDVNLGIVGNGTGVTLGTGAVPSGHSAGLPAITSKITDTGTATDQRFLPQVSAGNKLSVQNALPLTATSTASTATISVASHTLQYGYGQVSYNSGSISGLNTSTNYYVYADDPNYGGGAVSYLATTNPQTIVANNGRYYVGSIQTAISATVASISGATSANPIVFQASSHGFTSGDSVTFAALPGDFGTNLNGTARTVTVTDSNHFSVPVDGSAYTAYSSGGTATRVTTPTTGGGGGGGGGGHGGGILQ
jgi:hypothetical protein